MLVKYSDELAVLDGGCSRLPFQNSGVVEAQTGLNLAKSKKSLFAQYKGKMAENRSYNTQKIDGKLP
jgi:hypothetical protein